MWPSTLVSTHIYHARIPEVIAQIAAARELFASYAASLNVDLCIQNFEGDTADLPGQRAPTLGTLLAD